MMMMMIVNIEEWFSTHVYHTLFTACDRHYHTCDAGPLILPIFPNFFVLLLCSLHAR